MKRTFVIDELAICFFSAVGYGLGFIIPAHFDLPFLVCFAICYIPGLTFEEIAEHIVFSKWVQTSNIRRIISWLVMILIFIGASCLSFNILGEGLEEDLEEEFLFFVGIPFGSFVLSTITYWFKKRSIMKRYGNGSYTYLFSLKIKKFMKSLNGQNEEIVGNFDDKNAVKTDTGTFVPKVKKDVLTFLGVPYAQPPVGKLENKPPKPLPKSDKVYEAKYFGPSAPQPDLDGNILRLHRQSEDCLYLNIWAANDDKKNKKVIVYIPGGSYSYGGSANPVGYGTRFVKDNPDVIFVSINFRLGELGFGKSPNLGLLDQVEALRWINKNIKYFGGDKNNVTLLGASTGAACAMLLSTIKEAKGLFKKVIAMSMTLELDEGQFVYLPKADGKIIPKDIFENFAKYVDPGIEFMIGLPKFELSHVRGSVGSYLTEKIHDHYWDIYIDSIDSEKLEKSSKLLEGKNTIFQNKDKEIAFIEFVMYMLSPLIDAKNLSEKNSVYCFFWDDTHELKSFEGNSNSFISTLLLNKKAGAEYGFYVADDLHTVLEAFVKKFINSEKLSLHKNEIIGMDKIDWPKYEKTKQQVMSFNYKKVEVIKNFMRDEIKLVENLYN